MHKRDLLVVGELNIDLILNQIQGFPEMGSEKVAQKMDVVLGSSSAIFASNIATLGVETAFCGKVGKDDFGEMVRETLDKKQVDTSYISSSDELKTGLTVVMNYDQDRANVTYCGAMEALTINDIPWEKAGEFKHFHLSNYFLQKGIQEDITAIFQRAKQSGMTTSLDLQVDPDDHWGFDYKKCLPYVDIFLPNEAELLSLTGKESVEEALEEVTPYVNTVALKMGMKGGLVYEKGHVTEVKAFVNDRFVDAIGAGDSFNAGFICKYLQGADWEACLRFANLTGALNTTAAGGTGAFVSLDAVKQRAKSQFDQEI
ncbi:carbohydrate kinase family protein [Echinicola strongylocentroti]|uniref:Carbohydrate kinase family protein n=1 Tax=Echinicola strongylocentroti TaxID=1795355 RepID=A0A2Z4IGB1_9BACT|nr:carbohydrate kinase family protein [Echinicola strongylocentroti]AWW29945.1 carbohydrate kinase family protein [Echinicola strongylocentroti]